MHSLPRPQNFVPITQGMEPSCTPGTSFAESIEPLHTPDTSFADTSKLITYRNDLETKLGEVELYISLIVQNLELQMLECVSDNPQSFPVALHSLFQRFFTLVKHHAALAEVQLQSAMTVTPSKWVPKFLRKADHEFKKPAQFHIEAFNTHILVIKRVAMLVEKIPYIEKQLEKEQLVLAETKAKVKRAFNNMRQLAAYVNIEKFVIDDFFSDLLASTESIVENLIHNSNQREAILLMGKLKERHIHIEEKEGIILRNLQAIKALEVYDATALEEEFISAKKYNADSIQKVELLVREQPELIFTDTFFVIYSKAEKNMQALEECVRATLAKSTGVTRPKLVAKAPALVLPSSRNKMGYSLENLRETGLATVYFPEELDNALSHVSSGRIRIESSQLKELNKLFSEIVINEDTAQLLASIAKNTVQRQKPVIMPWPETITPLKSEMPYDFLPLNANTIVKDLMRHIYFGESVAISTEVISKLRNKKTNLAIRVYSGGYIEGTKQRNSMEEQIMFINRFWKGKVQVADEDMFVAYVLQKILEGENMPSGEWGVRFLNEHNPSHSTPLAMRYTNGNIRLHQSSSGAVLHSGMGCFFELK